MRVKTDNVERVVSDEYGRELVASKKAVEVPEKEVETNSLEKLKVDELKALASEKGIEGAATMKKSELLDILKDVV
jgi:transcription termination factor rho